MPVCLRRRHPAAGRSLKESVLHEKGLVHFLDRTCVFTYSSRDGRHADGTSVELLDDRFQDSGVHVIQAELVDVEQLKRVLRDVSSDAATRLDLRVVSNPAEQAVRDSGSSTRAAGDLLGTSVIDLDLDDVGSAPHDRLEVACWIEVETLLDAEPRTHRRSQHA